MNGYNFTERVRKVLALAREQASRSGHPYVGTEHILLALLEEGEGTGATTLKNLGVDLAALTNQIVEIVKKGYGGSDGPDLPYTSRAKKVLELTMTEARALHHSYVGTEHLLLGLLAEQKGIAAMVLVESGVTLETARVEILKILGGSPADGSHEVSCQPRPAGRREVVGHTTESYRIVAVHSPDDRSFLRHTLATLAYRGGKALRGAPPSFASFRAAPGSRTPAEILAHIGDLLDWADSQLRGEERWTTTPPAAWDDDVARFHNGLVRVDVHLATDTELRASTERLFQGPIADALTHVGQLTMLRRLAGAPMRGENYAKADIQRGRLGPTQTAPDAEFD
jgi:hypothetical protein